jgi:hypothetical protein
LIALVATLGALAEAPCDLGAPADAPFRHPLPPSAGAVRLVVEIHADDGDPSLVRALLGALADRQRPGTLVLPLPPSGDDLPEALAALGADAVAAGHEVAVTLPATEVSQDPYALDGPLRRRRGDVASAVDGKVRSVVTDAWGVTQESHLSRAGFRALLTTAGPATAVPRMGSVFEGQPRVSAVLMTGPWAGACGRRHDLGPFTPVAADRAAQAIHGAARGSGIRVVRVGLDDVGTPDEAHVLGRWIDEVLAPAGVQIVSASEAKDAALRAMRRPDFAADLPDEAAPTGRLVLASDLRAAAEGLAGLDALPRRLPGELTPAEAFLGFAMLLGGQTEGDQVRLAAIAGPRSHAAPTIDGPTPVDRDALGAVVGRLVAAAPAEVPAALPVGNRLYTASELLSAMASAVRGDEPPVASPLQSPDPDAAGLGWAPADAF